MKKITILIIAIAFVQFSFGQLSLTNQTNGTVSVEYGANNDYSLYDPQGDPKIYIYMWVDTNQTNPALSMVYNDDWNDTAGLVVLNYDSNAQKFTGTIDFNTHDFSGEGIIPSGTQINDFNFILRNQAGDRQSSDLLATNYGFQPTTTAGMIEIPASKVMYYSNRQLFITPDYLKQNIDVQIFNMEGKMILQKNKLNKSVNLSNLSKEIYIIKATINKQKYAVMKIVL